MNEDVQRHLLEVLDLVRTGPYGDHTEDEWKRLSLSRFAAALEALQAVGALSEDESQDWYQRALVASGLDVSELRGPLAHSFITSVFGYTPPEKPPARFLRMLPVPEPNVSIGFGGELQILGIELYDTKVGVEWLLSPIPDLEQARLLSERRYEALTDDVGTLYRHVRGNGWSSPIESRGSSQFFPAPPETASALTFHWGPDVSFAVPIRPNGSTVPATAPTRRRAPTRASGAPMTPSIQPGDPVDESFRSESEGCWKLLSEDAGRPAWCPEPVTCRGLRRLEDPGKERIIQVWSCDDHREGVEYARPLDEDRDRELLRAIIEGGRRAMGPDREPMPSLAAWQWRRDSPPIMVPGNPAAFSAVVETYHDELIDKAAELLGKSGTEAVEAVQKVFDQMLWLMTHMGVAEDLPLGPWLSMWLVDHNPSPEQIAVRAAAREEEWLRDIEEGHQQSRDRLARRLDEYRALARDAVRGS